MEVARYTFQSPSTSQVQVGKPDPTQKQETETKKATDELLKETNTQLKNSEEFDVTKAQETLVQNSAPIVESKNENFKGAKAEEVQASMEAKNENFKGANAQNINAKENGNGNGNARGIFKASIDVYA